MYQDYGYFATKNSLELMVRRAGLFSQTQQEIAHRVYSSVIRFLSLRKAGINCGFPRFKSFNRMKSLRYPQNGFLISKDGKKLRVTPFGGIKLKLHRPIEGRVKTLTLKREASGKWFAIFTAETPITPYKINEGPVVGIDLGLRSFAVISDGTIIKNPRHFKKYEKKLKSLQRRLSRKRLFSHNRNRERLRLAKTHEKTANARSDFLHKLSTYLVNKYSLIALEDLSIKEMAQEKYGKSIHDAGWSSFLNMVRSKAESAGCMIMFVDPSNTTQECSNCGATVRKLLKDRKHYCPRCGIFLDRDLNASLNILKRATTGHVVSNACRIASADGGATMKQEALHPLGMGACHVTLKYGNIMHYN